MNTADSSGTTMYPSGICDDGDYVFSAPPASVCPLVNIVSPIVLSGGSTLLCGTYAVKTSEDGNSLLFIEGCKVVCALPITENIIVDEYKDVPVVGIEASRTSIVISYHLENVLKRVVISLRQDC